MPRVTGRDPEAVRRVLFETYAEAAATALADSTTGSVLPVSVKEVLASVNERYVDDPRGIAPVTTGYLQSNFGGMQAFAEQALLHMLGPIGLGADLLATRCASLLLLGSDPTGIRYDLAEEDLWAAYHAGPAARIWLLNLATSERDSVGAMTRGVYRGFVSTFEPLLRLELAVRGLQLRDGVSHEIVLRSHTAVVEGLLLQVLADPDVESTFIKRPMGYPGAPSRHSIVGAMSEAALLALTTETASVNPPPGDLLDYFAASVRDCVAASLDLGDDDTSEHAVQLLRTARIGLRAPWPREALGWDDEQVADAQLALEAQAAVLARKVTGLPPDKLLTDERATSQPPDLTIRQEVEAALRTDDVAQRARDLEQKARTTGRAVWRSPSRQRVGDEPSLDTRQDSSTGH